MKCRFSKDELLEKQYPKKIWEMFSHKPAFTYCIKYDCVCFNNAGLKDIYPDECFKKHMWKLWEEGKIRFNTLLKYTLKGL